MWNQRYSESGFAYGTAPNDFIAKVAPRFSKGQALVLAAGEGRNAVFLAEEGLCVTAVDRSTVGVEKTKRLAKERGVVLSGVVGDLANFDLGTERWDVITSVFCHLPPALRKEVHAGIVRALKPGGLLALEAYTPAQLPHGTGGPKNEALMMTLEGLTQELEGLELLIGQELEREIEEGRYHRGTSAVVQVLARKPVA